jgi:putative phosphoribosyl transferase
MLFADRSEAGRRLALELRHLQGDPSVVVLGLPRGGVPVALEVARSLGVRLDVMMVRKLGVPRQPELAMGAIGEGGVRIVNEDVVRRAGVTERELEEVAAKELVELQRRALRFRGPRRQVSLQGHTVVVVDDGLATGATARAACEAARGQGAARVVLAVPVAPHDWVERMTGSADEYVCVSAPLRFSAVGEFYGDFSQTTDEQVIECLRRAGPVRR